MKPRVKGTEKRRDAIELPLVCLFGTPLWYVGPERGEVVGDVTRSSGSPQLPWSEWRQKENRRIIIIGITGIQSCMSGPSSIFLPIIVPLFTLPTTSLQRWPPRAPPLMRQSRLPVWHRLHWCRPFLPQRYNLGIRPALAE